MFETAQDARRFIEAGKAIVTVKSKKSGKHLTFAFRKANKGTAVYFVSLRNAQRARDDRYLGLYNADTNKFVLTRSSSCDAKDPEPRTVNYLLKNFAAGVLPKDAEISHSGRCGRCARLLTHPESLATGYGPECAGKVKPRKAFECNG